MVWIPEAASVSPRWWPLVASDRREYRVGLLPLWSPPRRDAERRHLMRVEPFQALGLALLGAALAVVVPAGWYWRA
jgi:hypothetical protein